jgi:hypothetical protein
MIRAKGELVDKGERRVRIRAKGELADKGQMES